MIQTDEQRDITEIQKYVNKKEFKLKASNGDTILHIACIANKVNIVKHLLHSHKFDPNVRNNTGETPLRWTFKYRAYQNVASTSEFDLSNLVSMFVKESKWKPSLYEVDDDGNTLFHLACQANQPNLVELLIPSVKLDCSLKNID